MDSEYQPEQQTPLRNILKMVGSSDKSDRLQLKWWTHGAEVLLKDPDVLPDAELLTRDQRDALVSGDLCKLKEELDKEPHAESEDAATLGPSWALVRI